MLRAILAVASLAACTPDAPAPSERGRFELGAPVAVATQVLPREGGTIDIRGGALDGLQISVDPDAYTTETTWKGFNSDLQSVAVHGERAYLAGLKTYADIGVLAVADLADPLDDQRPRGVAELHLGDDGLVDVALAPGGAWAYVTADGGAFWVIDLSDPDAPVARGSLPAGPWGGGGGIAWVREGLVATVDPGLRLIDVSDPDAPSVRNDVDVYAVGYGRDVAAAGPDLLWEVGATGTGWGGFLIGWDIRDAASPELLWRLDLDGVGTAIAVEGGQAFVAQAREGGGRMSVIDLGR